MPKGGDALTAIHPRIDPTQWWVVFFAPSSAEFALPVLRGHLAFPPTISGEDGQKSRFCNVAAIGPTTSTHVEEVCGVKVCAVAKKPTPEALGEALLSRG